MMDLVKLVVAGGTYLVLAPLWGFVISRHRNLEVATVSVMVFSIGLHIDSTVIMAGSIEWYRGVTKGYEFNIMEALAISLVACALLDPRRRFRWLPQGTLLWILYVLLCSLSLFSALNVNYVLMSIFKFSKCWIIVYAVCNSIRDEDDLKMYLDAFVILIVYQSIVVLKMKYIDGFYQVRGLFEHQNPLAMFTYMAVLPLLAAGLSSHLEIRRSLFYLAGYAAGTVIILSALSRASLAFFGIGSALVVGAGIFLRPSIKRFSLAALGCIGLAVVLGLTLDTIISRFHDEGNQASGETREVMNQAAAAMARDKSLGVGWNNFGKAINYPYSYGDVIDDWNRERGMNVDEEYAKGVVESIYYLHLGENGYPGLIAFILVIGMQILRSGWYAVSRRRSLTGDLALGIFIAMLVTATHLQFERVLTQTKNLALWMVLFGMVAAFSYNRRDIKNEKSGATATGGILS